MHRNPQWGSWDWLGIGASLIVGTALLLGSGSIQLLGLLCIGLAGGLIIRDRSPDSRSREQPRLVTDGGTEEIELVTAIIRPGKLNAVKQALAEAGAPALTVTNVSGRGTQPSETGQWRGEEYIVDLHQKVKIECVVSDVPSERVVDVIQDAAHTGSAGDGKIFVMPVSDARRVSTKERGQDAV